MKVYRVTQTRTVEYHVGYKKLVTRNLKRVRIATRQRLGCILAYQDQLPADQRWTLKVEEAEVGAFVDVTDKFPLREAQ